MLLKFFGRKSFIVFRTLCFSELSKWVSVINEVIEEFKEVL